MAIKRVKAVIKGRVQGVFFRAYTQEEALRLGLTGWVRNLPDGSVEAVMEGETAQVDRMIEWLNTGSPMATVSRVLITEEEPCGEECPFAIRY